MADTSVQKEIIPKKEVRKYRYSVVTDHEQRDKTGNGVIRWRVKNWNDDGTPRDDQEVKQEIQVIRDQMKKKNEEYARSLGKTLADGIRNTAYKEVIIQSPLSLSSIIKYEPLQMHLDSDTGNTGAIFGSSKRGKTTLLMEIYKKYYQSSVPDNLIPIAFVKNSQIGAYAKNGLIKIDEWKPEIIEAERKIQKFSKNKHEFLNLIDDFLDIKHQKMLDNLILSFRNSKISSYICLQYVNALSKSARSNVNNVFIFGQNTDEAADVSINCYLASYFRTNKIPKDQWTQVFHKITSDHGFFHIYPSTMEVRICKL